MKKQLFFSAFALLLASVGAYAQNTQKITLTIAGNGAPATSGDGGSARYAMVKGPKDITLDANENLYFAERGSGLIRRIDKTTNIITTVGGGGYSMADGVPATTALIAPNYLAINSTGDIYFTTGFQVRKINGTTGIISTVAGSLSGSYFGDGGPASAAMFMNPQGIAIDALDNIYIADHGNNRIRKITAATGIITTIAGIGTGARSGDGFPATNAALWGPVCVAVDPSYNVYISDQNPNYPNYDNSIIRMIDASGIITTIAGNTPTGYTCDYPATSCTIGTTTGLYYHRHSGDLYCNEMSCSCRRWHHGHHGDPDSLMLVGGNFAIQSFTDDIKSDLGNMNIPYGLCVDAQGSVYVADSNNQRIRKIVPLSNTPMFAFGRGQYINPTAGTAYAIESMLWVADIDSGQTETWTVISAPMHGTLAGFPATVASNGIYRTTHPTSLSYTMASSYTGPDMFVVRVNDPTGLSDTVTFYVGSNLVALGTNSVNKVGASVNIYPNPVSSILNVEWSDLPTTTSAIEITSITDRLMYQSKVDNNTNKGTARIDISSFPAGVYVLRLDGAEVRKFVKQ